jgi:hypothetical protein
MVIMTPLSILNGTAVLASNIIKYRGMATRAEPKPVRPCTRPAKKEIAAIAG